MAMLTCLITGLILIAGQTSAPEVPWVIVQDAARGRNVLAFAAQNEPFKPGVLPRGGETRDTRDADGRTITGIGYYGWISGSNVRVLVLAEVPADKARPESFPSDNAAIRYEPVANYTLAVDESRLVTELTAFGAEPTIVRIERRR